MGTVVSGVLGPGAGGQPLEGPILADYLAMGAGRAVCVPTAPGFLARPPAPRIPPLASAGPAAGEAQGSVARERRLVVAALQRREALGQMPSQMPHRGSLSDRPFRSRDQVPQLFAEGYAGYLESCREDSESPEQTAVRKDSNTAPLQNLRLRVRPWHRTALQKMLCRAVLFHFLQDRREALGLHARTPPLWVWEVRPAQEHSAAGEVEALVKYLVETELHIKLGPERSTHWPGSPPPKGAADRLWAERRRLARGWGLSERQLEEDAVVRVFLDGGLSWPRVRELLGPAPSARLL